MSDEGEKKWPSVNIAYGFVLPSYQLMISRFEAADTRLTSLLTLASTLTIAVPIFAKNVRSDISFASPFFVLGIVFFLCAGAMGVYGRLTGSLKLPDPMVIYNKSLENSEWEFKKNHIFFAGEAFEYNAQAIRAKGNVAICLTIVLLLEVLAFVAWIALKA